MLLLLRIADPASLAAVRLRVLDAYQALLPRQPDERLRPVLIVDIDEASLESHGQWPWPRDRVAALVDRIAAQGPAAIGFDILFAEPDAHSPEQLLARHPDLPPAARDALAALVPYDAQLAHALSGSRSVLGVGPQLGMGGARCRVVRRPPARMEGGDPTAVLPAFDRAVCSLDVLSAAAAGHASIGTTPEPDGIVRRVPTAIRVGDAILPCLAVEMLRVGLGASSFTISMRAGGVIAVGVGPYRLPTEPDGRAWVPHTAHQPWRFVPADQVLAGTIPDDLFRGRLVLVGTTALGLSDLNTTPVADKMYGVEIHAEMLEAILADAMLRRPVWAARAELLAAALGGLLILMLGPVLAPRWAPLPLAATVVAIAGGGWGAYRAGRFLLDPSFPIGAAALVFTVMLVMRLAEVDRNRQRIAAELRAQREEALRLEGEMAAARDIQMRMLPPGEPETGRSDLEIRAWIAPAREVGGDLYDFLFLDRDRLFFVVGDVSGKGVPAALFMSLTQALCRSAALRLGSGAEAILRDVNESLARQNDAMMFVTAFAGILDLANGQIDYCSAGHDAAWIAGRSVPPRRLADGGGPPLGAVQGFGYVAGRGRLEPGEFLLLLTDGVTEATNPAGDLYGSARVAALLERLDAGSAAELLAGVRADVERFVAGAEPADDLTLLAIHRLGA
jgi:serine phosphatase RsbU (regulator of sigma subunit)/CHASE2 domain-containing sensor protein